MPHTVPGPSRAPGVAPLQQISPVSPCSEGAPQPQGPLGTNGLLSGPRNAPGADRGVSGTFGKVRLSTAGAGALPVCIHNAGTARATCASASSVRAGQASATAPFQPALSRPAVGVPESVASIMVQRLIDTTICASLAGSGPQAAHADCPRALLHAWLTFCDALVAAACADTPIWFSDVSERAPEAVKAELTRIAHRSLEDILSTARFKPHLQSSALMAPLRAPIKQWLALHVAELQHAGAAQGRIDAQAGANYLRQMDALLELPLLDIVKNGTLRCLLSAIAILPTATVSNRSVQA